LVGSTEAETGAASTAADVSISAPTAMDIPDPK